MLGQSNWAIAVAEVDEMWYFDSHKRNFLKLDNFILMFILSILYAIVIACHVAEEYLVGKGWEEDKSHGVGEKMGGEGSMSLCVIVYFHCTITYQW